MSTSATLSRATIGDALRSTGYLPSEGLSTVLFLATAMNRPLLLEGEPGTGKTSLAEAWATVTGAELIRLQCYEGIEASQALYDWDFARQILHIRAVEAAAGDDLDASALEESLFHERFLLERPILKALRSSNAVLLIDEIDRADDEFEAFLLEVLSTFAVTIPEYGEVRAATPPMVVITSNRTRELHDALKRRCLYHWIDHPQLAREIEIIRTRLPDVSVGAGDPGGVRGAADPGQRGHPEATGGCRESGLGSRSGAPGPRAAGCRVRCRDSRCSSEVPRGCRASPPRPGSDPYSVTGDDRLDSACG